MQHILLDQWAFPQLEKEDTFRRNITKHFLHSLEFHEYSSSKPPLSLNLNWAKYADGPCKYIAWLNFGHYLEDQGYRWGKWIDKYINVFRPIVSQIAGF